MSSTFFDTGDLQRLERERSLTEQRDRIPIENDRSPEEESELDFDFILDALLDILRRRLE